MRVLAVVITVAIAFLGSAGGWDLWAFNINIERHSDKVCSSKHTRIGKESVVHEGDRKSWPGQPSFTSFRYTWAPKAPWQSDHLNRVGNCEIRVWGGDNCQGESIGRLKDASTYEKLGTCSAPGYLGAVGSSVMVVCRHGQCQKFGSKEELAS